MEKEVSKHGLTIKQSTLGVADDQILVAQDYEDINYMTRKLIDEYIQGGNQR